MNLLLFWIGNRVETGGLYNVSFFGIEGETMIRVGDIVTDLEQDSCYFEKQGCVVAIQFRFWGYPEITVRFDTALYPYYIPEDELSEGIYEVYPPRSLRKDADWDPAVHARRLFKDKWHSVQLLNMPLNSDDLCMVEGCGLNQQQTVWFNTWGTVCNAHVCSRHAPQYHGLCGDSFPWRKGMSA